MNSQECKALWDRCLEAGHDASYGIPDTGAVGWGWVTVRPARGPFVGWLKGNDIGRKGSHGGWHIDSRYMGQSMRGNYAWAEAVADILESEGFDVQPWQLAD